VHILEDVDAFEGKVSELQSSSKATNRALMVHFTGAEAANGTSWCGDCRLADPVLHKILYSCPKAIVLVAKVQREAYKGNPNYPYRTNKLVRLVTVPTVMKWGTRERLEEGQCADEGLVQLFLD